MAAISPAERSRQSNHVNWEKVIKYGAGLVTAAAVLVWTAISLIGNQPEQPSPARNRQNPSKPEPMLLINGRNMTCDELRTYITPNTLSNFNEAYPAASQVCKLTSKVGRPPELQEQLDKSPHSP